MIKKREAPPTESLRTPLITYSELQKPLKRKIDNLKLPTFKLKQIRIIEKLNEKITVFLLILKTKIFI